MKLGKRFLLTIPFLFLSSTSALPDEAPTPQSDFYQWANQEWLGMAVIPADKSKMDNFVFLKDKVTEELHQLLLELEEREDLARHERQVLSIYQALLDMDTRNKRGADPIQKEFRAIDAASSHSDIAVLFSTLQKAGVDPPIGHSVSLDLENSSRNIIYTGQAGLSLEREEYLGTDAAATKAKQAYKKKLQSLYRLAGFDRAEELAEKELAFEARLAKLQWSNVDNANMQKIHNVTDFAGLVKQGSNLEIEAQFKELGLPTDFDTINVAQPSYIEALNELLPQVDLDTWKLYLKTRVLMSFGPLLSQDFKDVFQAYEIERGFYLEPPQPETEALDYVNEAVAMLLGRIYVENEFDESVKAEVEQITKSIVDEYRIVIGAADWLTEPTRKRALEKLDQMTFKIAYPSEWPDYTGLEVSSTDPVQNQRNILEDLMQRSVAKLGKPDAPNEWGYGPQAINAFYSPSSNSFVLLAGILQPPFFDPYASTAEKYGGLGFVVGHEIGHAFDNRGSLFDGQGNMNNWWTAEDRKAYEEITAALIAQAAAYEVLPGQPLNAELEIGEIIGDMCGAQISLAAFNRILEREGGNRKEAYRTFYKRLARTWRRKIRPDMVIQLLKTDPHPPAEFRGNGIVKNFDEFHEAYDVQPGDPMFMPESERVNVW